MSTVNDKLRLIRQARDDIKTSLENKGQTVDTDIRTYASAIENITIGTDTSDATASVDDIISPKTAYVDGQKITGNIIATSIPLNMYQSLLTESPIQAAGDVIGTSEDGNYLVSIYSGNFLIYEQVNNSFILSKTISMTSTGSPFSGNPTVIQIAKLPFEDNNYNMIVNSGTTHYIFTINFQNLSIVYRFTSSGGYYPRFSNKSSNIFGTALRHEDGSWNSHLYIYKINENSCTTLYDKRANSVAYNSYIDFQKNDQFFDYVCPSSSWGMIDEIVRLNTSYEVVWYSNLSDAYYLKLFNNSDYCLRIYVKTQKIEYCSYTLSGSTFTFTVLATWNLGNNNDCSYILDDKDKILFKISGSSCISYELNGTTIPNKLNSIACNNFRRLTMGVSVNSSQIYTCVNGIVYGIKTIYDNYKITDLTRQGVKFVDTYDAIATSDDILQNKTAYVNGEKLTGTMPNLGKLEITPREFTQELSKGYITGGVVNVATIANSDEYDDCLDYANCILNHTTKLPYKQLSYIQTDGNQWIATGLNASSDLDAEIKFKTLRTGTGYGRVIGTTNDVNYEFCDMKNISRYRFSINGRIRNDIPVDNSNFNTVKIIGTGKLYINNKLIVDLASSPASAPVQLFTCMSGREGGVLQVVYCKMWKANELVRYYVPASDKDSTICLYDKVTKEYYYNQGTGVFMGGAEV